MDPENVRNLNVGVIWNFTKGTDSHELDFSFGGTKGLKKAHVPRDREGSNPFIRFRRNRGRSRHGSRTTVLNVQICMKCDDGQTQNKVIFQCPRYIAVGECLNSRPGHNTTGNFPCLSILAPTPTQPPFQWVVVYSGGCVVLITRDLLVSGC